METGQKRMTCLLPSCKNLFMGNENKKFCSLACKNAFHNEKRKTEQQEIGNVINILKSNRRILAAILGSNQVKKISEQRLLDKGFIFRYHTHRRINKGDNKEYIFCFDVGYVTHAAGWYTVVKAFKESE